ncbi:MAG: hypothetical protein KDA96_00520 [Planctomycetaceae bacterium]|nr:hypothetical protein [Planctomycetaceae bacterium]
MTSFLASAGYCIWRRVFRPLTETVRNEELGAAIDLQFPELHEAIATVLSVDQPDHGASGATSPVMKRHLLSSISLKISDLAAGEIVNPRRTFRAAAGAAGAMLMFLIPLLLWHSGSVLLLKRFAMPLANLETASNLYFEIPDADRVVARGTDVQFRAYPRWRTGNTGALPDSVSVILQGHGAVAHADTIRMGWDEVNKVYLAILPDVQDSLTYRIEGGRARSRDHVINVATPPQIDSALLHAVPPEYTKLDPVVNDGMEGRVRVFEGSRVEMTLTFNKAIRDAQFVWDSWMPITMDLPQDEFEEASPEERSFVAPNEGVIVPASRSADGTVLTFEFEARGSGRFHFEFTDHEGLVGADLPTRELVIIEDQPPRLEVTGIRDAMPVRPDDVVPLDSVVTDDIGVGLLELHYQVDGGESVVIPAAGLTAGMPDFEYGFRLPLRNLNLTSGARLTLLVRAADQRPHAWPGRVERGPWELLIDEQAPPIGRQPLSERDQETLDNLRGMAAKLQHDAEEAAKLGDNARQKWNQDDRNEARGLSEREQQQGQQVQQIASEIADHPLMQQQAQAISDLGSEIRNGIGQQLKDAANAAADQATQDLRQASGELTEAGEQLNRLADEFERIARVEQELTELNRLALDAEQLARDAGQLQQDRQTGMPEAGQSQQEFQDKLDQRAGQLASDRDQLEREIGELLDRQQDLRESAQRSQTEQLAELADRAEQLAAIQQSTTEALQNEQNGKGVPADQQQQVAADTAELRDQLRELSERMNLPALQMQDEAVHASEAEAAAEQAAQDAARAAQELSDGRQEEAVQSGQQTADELRLAAEAARGQAPSESAQGVVPTEVGQSVAEALQNLSQAQEDIGMQQSAQPGDDSQTEAPSGSAPDAQQQSGQNQSGQQNGQPGQQGEDQQGNPTGSAQQGDPGQSGQAGESQQGSSQQGQQGGASQPLSQAAQSLAEAAKNALPQQFTPGQLSDPGASSGKGRSARGNDAGFDGNLPGRTRGQHERRDWGQLNDELDGEMSGAATERPDSDYADLIRRYNREKARAAARQRSGAFGPSGSR